MGRVPTGWFQESGWVPMGTHDAAYPSLLVGLNLHINMLVIPSK